MSGSDRFEIVTDPMLGESVWITRTAAGMPVRLVPTERFRETAAVVTVAYGSADLGFAAGDEDCHSPLGVAHYLEHKLFEDEQIAAFDRFARRGAQVNAMTGFTRTSYFFTATQLIEDNLGDLLRLVTHPHVTTENVDKERGIIAQEIRMYEDSPDYRGFFDLLQCLYHEHPVRHPVGGTVESIQDITAEHLLACYRAFYRAGNAAVAVAGPIDPGATLAGIERQELAPGGRPRSLYADDLGPPARRRSDRTMQIARPRLMLGVKDREPFADVEDRTRRQLVTRMLLELLLAPSSERRDDLSRRRVVDDSLSYSYLAERSFAFVAVGAETDRPDQLEGELRQALTAPLAVRDDDLERVSRRVLGGYVRSFESVRGMAFSHGEQAVEGVAPFGLLPRLRSVTKDELMRRQCELLRDDEVAVAVVAPPAA